MSVSQIENNILTFSNGKKVYIPQEHYQQAVKFIGKKVISIFNEDCFPLESIPPQGYVTFLFENGGKINTLMDEEQYKEYLYFFSINFPFI